MKRNVRRAVFSTVSGLSFFVSVLLFNFFGLSSRGAILFPIKIINSFLSSGSGAFVESSLEVLSNLAPFVLSFVPISVGFGLLALYGSKFGEDRKVGLGATLPVAVVGCVLSGFSFVSIFLYGAIILSGILITGYGGTYSEELDRWSSFRTGTSSLGKTFLLITVLLTLGLFLQTASGIDGYRSEYRNATNGIITDMTSPDNLNVSELSDEEFVQQLPKSYREQLNSLPESQRDEVISQMRQEAGSQVKTVSSSTGEVIKNRFLRSEKFSSLLDLTLFTVVLSISGLFYFLSKVLYTLVGGLVTLIGEIP